MDIKAWYFPTMLVQDDATLAKRKTATAAIVAEIQPKQAIELVKVALGLPYSANVVDAVMKPYMADEGFSPAAQPHATEILVDCVLASALEEPGIGIVTALGILCGTSIIGRVPKHHPELVDFADAVCGSGMSAAVPPLPKLTKLREAIAAQITPIQADAATPPQLAAALKPVFSSAVQDQRETVRFSEDLVETLEAQQQQINILWWMLGEWSEKLERPFEKVPPAAAPIVAGLELATLVVTEKIPRSAKAVLHKVITKAGDIDVKQSLIEAVNASPRSWREKADFERLPQEIQDLTPILFALKTSLVTDAPETWQPVFEKAIKTKKFVKLDKVDIAVQAFREALLWQLTE